MNLGDRFKQWLGVMFLRFLIWLSEHITEAHDLRDEPDEIEELKKRPNEACAEIAALKEQLARWKECYKKMAESCNLHGAQRDAEIAALKAELSVAWEIKDQIERERDEARAMLREKMERLGDVQDFNKALSLIALGYLLTQTGEAVPYNREDLMKIAQRALDESRDKRAR